MQNYDALRGAVEQGQSYFDKKQKAKMRNEYDMFNTSRETTGRSIDGPKYKERQPYREATEVSVAPNEKQKFARGDMGESLFSGLEMSPYASSQNNQPAPGKDFYSPWQPSSGGGENQFYIQQEMLQRALLDRAQKQHMMREAMRQSMEGPGQLSMMGNYGPKQRFLSRFRKPIRRDYGMEYGQGIDRDNLLRMLMGE